MKNLYDLIPAGGNGCNKDLLWLLSKCSNLNDWNTGTINTLDDLNDLATEIREDLGI